MDYETDKERKDALPETKPVGDDIALGQGAVITLDGEVVNASGHRDQLHRGYGLLSICGLAMTVDNAWVVLGTSMTIAICRPPRRPALAGKLSNDGGADNGGPPGILYELLVAGMYYMFIAASVAEVRPFPSRIPSLPLPLFARRVQANDTGPS